MNIRKIIGAALLSAPFAGLAAITWFAGGWVAVLIVFGAVAVIVSVIFLGVHLLMTPPRKS
jgi:hypothetical protein